MLGKEKEGGKKRFQVWSSFLLSSKRAIWEMALRIIVVYFGRRCWCHWTPTSRGVERQAAESEPEFLRLRVAATWAWEPRAPAARPCARTEVALLPLGPLTKALAKRPFLRLFPHSSGQSPEGDTDRGREGGPFLKDRSGLHANLRQLLMLNNNIKGLRSLPAPPPPPPPQKELWKDQELVGGQQELKNLQLVEPPVPCQIPAKTIPSPESPMKEKGRKSDNKMRIKGVESEWGGSRPSTQPVGDVKIGKLCQWRSKIQHYVLQRKRATTSAAQPGKAPSESAFRVGSALPHPRQMCGPVWQTA